MANKGYHLVLFADYVIGALFAFLVFAVSATGFAATGSALQSRQTQAIGNIVINERIDHFTRDNGEDAFHITGMFLVKGGKIVEWQDYMWPKA